MWKTYIFWYGSLINENSAKLTNPNLWKFVPTIVKWYERKWNVLSKKMWIIAVWLEKNSDAFLNWVLIEVNDDIIKDFDIREGNYFRERIYLENIHILNFNEKIKKSDKIYVYIPKSTSYPSKKFPIVYSYLDVILEWCINISWYDFAKQFIETTWNWNKKYFVNDRNNPYYVRALDKLNYNLDELYNFIDITI